MKKAISVILVFILSVSLLSAAAYSEGNMTGDDIYTLLAPATKEAFKDKDDQALTSLFLSALVEMAQRGVITKDRMNDIYTVYMYGPETFTGTKSFTTTEYNYGKGTYIVGADLQAGTYDVVCTAVDDENLGDSMSALGDLYGSFGLDNYGSYFDSLGGLYDSVAEMYLTVYNANGIWDNMYTLKSGETARIVLTDGMKIEINDGSARLTFVR